MIRRDQNCSKVSWVLMSNLELAWRSAEAGLRRWCAGTKQRERERCLGREFRMKESCQGPGSVNRGHCCLVVVPWACFQVLPLIRCRSLANDSSLVNPLTCMNVNDHAMLLKGVSLSRGILQRQKKALITPRGLRAHSVGVKNFLVVSGIILQYRGGQR